MKGIEGVKDSQKKATTRTWIMPIVALIVLSVAVKAFVIPNKDRTGVARARWERGPGGAAYYLQLTFVDKHKEGVAGCKDYIWTGYLKNRSESVPYRKVRVRAGLHIPNWHGDRSRVVYSMQVYATPSGDLGPGGIGEITLLIPYQQIQQIERTGQDWLACVDVLAVCPDGQLYESDCAQTIQPGYD